MSEILKSTLLDFDKSFFYINFMKSSSGNRYFVVEQTMAGNYKKQQIKINPADLAQIISTLQMYQKEMSDPDSQICRNYLSEEKQKMVIERYFKGISANDLALQFDCTTQTINAILSTYEIEIGNQKEMRKQQMIEQSKRKY